MTIDAKGMTAMPGFIKGDINGPRIIPSGLLRLGERGRFSLDLAALAWSSERKSLAGRLRPAS